MIQTLTFHSPLGDRDPDKVMQDLRSHVDDLLKFQPVLRGFKVSCTSDTVVMQLRLSARDRWRIAAEGKRIAPLLLRRAKLEWTKVTLAEVVMETSRRRLTVENPRPPRGPKPQDDRSDWWGDTVRVES